MFSNAFFAFSFHFGSLHNKQCSHVSEIVLVSAAWECQAPMTSVMDNGGPLKIVKIA